VQAGTANYVGTKRTERDAAFPTAPHNAAQQKFDKDVKSLMKMLSVPIEIATAALNRCSNDVGSATELIIEGATDAEQIAKGADRRQGVAAEAAQQGAAAEQEERAAGAAQEQTEGGTDVQQTEGGIDVQQAKNKGGRKSKAILEESARLAAVQNMLKTSVCQKGCLSGSSGDYKSVERNKRNLANAITDWREDLLGVSNRGHALLQHMRENARNENKSGVKPRSFGCRFKIPNTECECCLDCWALAGDFAGPDPNTGKVRRSRMLQATLTAFNRFESEGDNLYRQRSKQAKTATQQSRSTYDIENGRSALYLATYVWIKMWLPTHSDKSVWSGVKMHLDCNSVKAIWEELDDEWTKMLRDVPSISLFRRVLSENFEIVIHKHKKFKECDVCMLFKELLAKTKHERVEIRAHIKSLRHKHLELVYRERMEYYIDRELSWQQPDHTLCIIIDFMTETSTSPVLTKRENHIGISPLKTAMCGVLIHGPEGFWAYTVNGLKGGHITCEVLHRTLLKLAKIRKVWPRNFVLQLDNTSGDNKNHTVKAYLSWLTATGVFEKVIHAQLTVEKVFENVFAQVTERFLPVGHTHEDIDAYFGILRRHIWTKGETIWTIDQLHEVVHECFHSPRWQTKLKEKLAEYLAEATEEGSEEASREEIPQKITIEHIDNYYGWYKWFIEPCRGMPRAFRKIDGIAQTSEPDVYRPHVVIYSQAKVEGKVQTVMNVKHWAHDTELWNTAPIVAFNRVPELKDLEPARYAGETEGRRKIIVEKLLCDEHFRNGAGRCKARNDKQAQVDKANKTSSPKTRFCSRCEQMEYIAKWQKLSKFTTMSDSHARCWEELFDNMVEATANCTLPPKRLPMQIKKQPDEKGSSVLDNLPRSLLPAPSDLECRYGGMKGATKAQMRSNLKRVQLADFSRQSTKKGAEFVYDQTLEVVAATRSHNGALEYAVVSETQPAGMWVKSCVLQNILVRGTEQWKAHFALMSFRDVVIQEANKCCYQGRLECICELNDNMWELGFGEQIEDTGLGLSATQKEQQLMSLDKLEYDRVFGGAPDNMEKTKVDGVCVFGSRKIEKQDADSSITVYSDAQIKVEGIIVYVTKDSFVLVTIDDEPDCIMEVDCIYVDNFGVGVFDGRYMLRKRDAEFIPGTAEMFTDTDENLEVVRDDFLTQQPLGAILREVQVFLWTTTYSQQQVQALQPDQYFCRYAINSDIEQSSNQRCNPTKYQPEKLKSSQKYHRQITAAPTTAAPTTAAPTTAAPNILIVTYCLEH
jgi:hypothetical protein